MYYVDHYIPTRRGDPWMTVAEFMADDSAAEASALALARAGLGSFNSGTRVRRHRDGKDTVIHELH